MAETKYKTLGEIGTFVRGGGLQKKDFRDNGVPCIHYGQVYTHYGSFADKTISYVSPELASTLKKAQKGDIIIVCTSENVEDVCKCVVWLGEEDVCVGGETYIFKHNQDPRYLAYNFLTEAFIDFKKKNYTGTKVFRIHENELKTFLVPLPPLAEQHAIASALTSIDNLIASLDKLIAKTQSVKQGAMQQLLMGLNSETVEYKKLGDICISLPKETLKTTQLKDSGYPVINSGREFYGYYSSYNNKGNALTIASRGEYAGFITYIEQRFWAGGLCYPYKSINEDLYATNYLYFYLKGKEKTIMDDLVERTSIPALNKADVELIEIPIPPIETQHRIASTLTAIDDQVSALEAKRKKYEMVKVGMMQQLLTGKIRLK